MNSQRPFLITVATELGYSTNTAGRVWNCPKCKDTYQIGSTFFYLVGNAGNFICFSCMYNYALTELTSAGGRESDIQDLTDEVFVKIKTQENVEVIRDEMTKATEQKEVVGMDLTPKRHAFGHPCTARWGWQYRKITRYNKNGEKLREDGFVQHKFVVNETQYDADNNKAIWFEAQCRLCHATVTDFWSCLTNALTSRMRFSNKALEGIGLPIPIPVKVKMAKMVVDPLLYVPKKALSIATWPLRAIYNWYAKKGDYERMLFVDNLKMSSALGAVTIAISSIIGGSVYWGYTTQYTAKQWLNHSEYIDKGDTVRQWDARTTLWGVPHPIFGDISENIKTLKELMLEDDNQEAEDF